MDFFKKKAAAGLVTAIGQTALTLLTAWAILAVFTIPVKIAFLTIQFLWNLVP